MEKWILEERVDCGFLKLPTHPDFETIFLKQDPLLAILPEHRWLVGCEKSPSPRSATTRFCCWKRTERRRLRRSLSAAGWEPAFCLGCALSHPNKRTRCARIPQHRPCAQEKKSASLAVKKFLDDLQYRQGIVPFRRISALFLTKPQARAILNAQSEGAAI